MNVMVIDESLDDLDQPAVTRIIDSQAILCQHHENLATFYVKCIDRWLELADLLKVCCLLHLGTSTSVEDQPSYRDLFLGVDTGCLVVSYA